MPPDPPIKRFAERHKYLGTDAIAVHDLGFVVTKGSSNGSSVRSNTSSLGRTETQQSIVSNLPASQPQQPASSVTKRPSSPDHRRKDESRGANDFGPPSKRQRAGSPQQRGHDRDRWERRRYGSPSPWDRERERDSSARRPDKERDDEKSVIIPPVLSWFIGQLPPPNAFDGTWSLFA